ncbi:MULTISPECIES: AAA family ATPase [unclassified Achromobacter]|uniref:AAA family ATPase n=1 Tax=unclassified Achromobacter TaxID=2626865 RepID=UPI000B519B6C|nr:MULTISPECIES: AAA family ATPase [unclassified Achromobacter]OWT74651.1 GTP-binding protein [Achromobacter sp. HZ34]OWT79118.1 GTP-binding protein [Achromobacter sp. HZ28]
MKLSRFRIAQFRQFRDAIEIDGLAPGLNLFTGPNETGKSTIVTALRAAFFERYRSNSAEDFRPWGDGAAAPSVTLDFEHGGEQYQLLKSFLGKKRCELQIGGAGRSPRRLDGAEAEDHLAMLLGFQHANKGASKAEHWGIPGLLWMAQGTAQDVREPLAHATGHLRSVLGSAVSDVASSHGDDIIARVESARGELLTARSGKPTGGYQLALDKRDQLAAAATQVAAEIEEYRHKVDDLARLRQAHDADEAQPPWLDAREQERAAARRLEEIQEIERTLGEQRVRVAQIEERTTLLRAQIEGYAKDARTAETRRVALAEARQAHEAAVAGVAPWRLRLDETTRQHEAASIGAQRARLRERRTSLDREHAALQAGVQAATQTLAAAQDEQARQQDHERRAAALRITEQDLAALREQARLQRELELRLSAVATRLEFALEAGQVIEIDGSTVQGSGERQLAKATALTLPGVGRLTITPGGADLTALRRQADEAGERLSSLLQSLDLASLDAAEARARECRSALDEAKVAAATLKGLAPQGLDALRSQLARDEARLREVEQVRVQLVQQGSDTEKQAEESGPGGESTHARTDKQIEARPATQAGAADAPVLSAQEAESRLAALERSLKQIGADLHKAQLAASDSQARVDAAQREHDAAQAALSAPGRAEKEMASRQSLDDTLAEAASARARVQSLLAQVEQARPDILKQDLERYRRSAEQLEQAFHQRRDALMRLDVELQAAGARGLEERQAEITRDLAQARRHAQELTQRAEALDRLLTLLRDKRAALTAQLQAPLRQHLQRYVQLLFPQGQVDLDTDLMPGTLARAGAAGLEAARFEELSFGAREQLGVISRLAYADLLLEAGRPTLIILDDALVHSDDQRLAQMKRVLFDAATRHQVLLFTCHPANWRDMGVAPRALEGLRTRA